jgi:hypothetical protein
MTTFFNVNTLNSIADVDNAARALSSAWESNFAPAPQLDGKKKAKLRNMICQLAGYTNGYPSFLAHLKDTQIQPTTTVFDLPDKLLITSDADMDSYLLIGGEAEGADPVMLDETSDNFLYGILLHKEYGDTDWEDCPSAQLIDVTAGSHSLKTAPFWQYLCQHYHVAWMDVIMPRIDKYGVIDCANSPGDIALLDSLWLTPSPEYMTCTTDRGDDGCAQVILTLIRK